MNSKPAEMASHSGLSKKPSEMRIILLGNKASGKSSSGNTILGSEEFSLARTGQCEKRQGDVGGRQVTVVDIPGWWKAHSLKQTSELIKQDIVLSASLCPTGPDALLLVIAAGYSYLADEYKNIEDHMQLLSQRVWSHTMILFTMGDCLGGKSIEQYIESKGEGLQRLVEKCGNRYHVFNNENRGDDTQVTQLFDKIQEVAGDKGGCFEIDRRVLEETEKKRRTQVEGATRRQMKVKKQRESIRSKMGDDLHLSEMRIILLGHECSGKSSSGNTILGSEEFSSATTAQSEKRQGDVAERQVTVVDTPGWSPYHSLKQTSELIKQQIAVSASLCPKGRDALLLVIRADASCTADTCKNIEDHMQLLSQTVWSHTMILFRGGDHLDGKSIEQYIESEGEGLQRLVEKCGNRYHVFNNGNRSDDTQVTELLLKIEEMDHYGTGRPSTPDTKPKAVENSPVPAKPKAVAASVPAQSKGTASCVPELKKRQCEVWFHYASQREDELELKVGDIIDFIREGEEGWWFGSLNGKSGLFPSNFVKELEASGEETDTSLSLDVIKEMKESQQKVNQDVQDQMQKMQSELQKINLRQTEADKKRASEARQHLTHGEAQQKLLSVRDLFVQRISESNLHSLLDKLLSKSVINDDEMDAAKGEKVRVEKARHVIDMVRRKGDEASTSMIDMISQLDRNLSDLLQLKPSLTD